MRVVRHYELPTSVLTNNYVFFSSVFNLEINAKRGKCRKIIPYHYFACQISLAFTLKNFKNNLFRFLNPLYPQLSSFIVHDVLLTFSMALTRRICLRTNSLILLVRVMLDASQSSEFIGLTL